MPEIRYKRIKTAIKRAADESQNVVNIFDPNAQDA